MQGQSKHRQKVKSPQEKEEEETKFLLAFHAEGKNLNFGRFLILFSILPENLIFIKKMTENSRKFRKNSEKSQKIRNRGKLHFASMLPLDVSMEVEAAGIHKVSYVNKNKKRLLPNNNDSHFLAFPANVEGKNP